MIVTTAGHIDHGKTALIKALTGTDTDRLPEEKARGITVDLGFAYRRLPDGTTIGFVDVPGHERLVKTMMAGASGTDLALIAVAADDGVMPQTFEHIAVLDLLGIRHAIVAITKSDKAAPERLDAVRTKIEQALAPTAMANAEILACSSLTGDGIPELIAAIEHAAGKPPAPQPGRFRLAVDRSFLLPGIGLVAAGTVHSGTIRLNDTITVAPAGLELRVRAIHVHDQAATQGHAGQRVALNLVGVRAEKSVVTRGTWLIDPALQQSTTRLDVQLRLLPGEAAALKHWTPVHIHLGTATSTGRVGLNTPIAPGDTAFAQLVLDTPIAALASDRFALRDASAQRTIGGGRVIDPFPASRRPPNRPALLAAASLPDPAEAFAALLEASPNGLDPAAFRRARNLPDGESITAAGIGAGSLAFAPRIWAAHQDKILAALREHHDTNIDVWGVTTPELAATFPHALRPTIPMLLRHLAESGRLARTGQLWHEPGRTLTLTPTDTVLWEDAQSALLQAGLDPPRLTFLAERLGTDLVVLRTLLDKLACIGWLHRASSAYYLMPVTAARLADAARECASESPDQLLTVGRFRDRTGTGRHATMPILEFFDRIGFTRRLNEGRRIATPWPGA